MKKLSFFLGIFGPIALMVLSGLAMHLNPQFNTSTNPESDLVNLPFGWLQNAAFVAGGIGFFLLGISMELHQKKTRVAPFLVMLFGVAFVFESFFPSQSNTQGMDPTTAIHILIFASGTVGMIAATALFAKAIGKISHLFSVYSLLTTLVSAVGFVGIFFTQGSVGIWQQITIFPLLLWMEIMGVYTFVKSKQLS